MDSFRLLIGGRLEPGAATMDVINPSTEQVFRQAPRASAAQLEQAVAAAKAAFPAWSATPLQERRKVLNKIADVLEANAAELAELLVHESGKTFGLANIEIQGAAGFTRYFASLELPVKTVDAGPGRKAELHRRALGVVAAFIPWNTPMLILGFKLPPALLAGNTVVLKPAPTTPLATLRFAELVADVLPPGVLNVITDANDLGDALSRHVDVRKVSFTGSIATGRKIMNSAAQTLKRVTLELGGNDAAIVLSDADPKAIAPQLFDAAFLNSGQVCLAIKRLYVHESIYDAMCAELAALANAAKMGDVLDPQTQIGPVQNRQQYLRVRELLDDARRHGRVIAGGEVSDGPGYFIRPTIVRDISDGARLVDEEQFGPVLPVIKFSDPEDALRRANAVSHGLGGSVWSADASRAYELAKRMDAGTVWVNTHMSMTPNVPFGGTKQSGMGVEFGEEGFAEFTQLHVVNIEQ